MKLRKQKKVDIIVKYFFPVTAGIEVNVMETYRRLVEMGWDVTLHTSTNTYLKKNWLPREELMNGIRVKRYPFKWYGFFPEIDYSTTDIVTLHNFDIFPHLHILGRTLVAKMFGKKNYKLAITPHGGFNPEWRIFSFIEKIVKSTYHYTLGTILINLVVDGVRAVSEWEKDEMIKKGVRTSLIRVIDNGIEDEAYVDIDRLASRQIKKKVESFGKYIFQMGRVYKIKNYETTIKALALLPSDVKYIIAGPIQEEGNYIKNLRELISSLKLQERVLCIGVLKGIDKYYVVKHAQLMVHMALWESYCNVIHEGLSQGLPCVVANNTALPLLIKNDINGYCVETRNYKSVADKLNYILKNKNTPKIKKMEETNREFGLKNSWQSVSEKINDFYSTLIGS